MGRRADKHIERTIAYLLRCPASTVPEVMQACKYSTNESVYPAKQMAVRRAHQKVIDAKKKATPPNVINTLTVRVLTMSPQTAAVTGNKSTSPPSTPMTPGGAHGQRGQNPSQISSGRTCGGCRSIASISSHCRTMQSMR